MTDPEKDLEDIEWYRGPLKNIVFNEKCEIKEIHDGSDYFTILCTKEN